VDTYNKKHGTDVDGLRDATLGALEGHDWPGNVRELRNVIERATIVAREGWISVPDLPPYLRGGTPRPTDVLVLPLGIPAREAEKRLILRTLELVENNKAEAARRLELDPKTIRNKLKAWEDEEEDEEASNRRPEEDGTPAS
jgi:DNA-binding NtrC family response regulator